MSDWWTCAGVAMADRNRTWPLPTEDVLAASAELAAFEYAIAAGKEDRAESGDVIRVTVTPKRLSGVPDDSRPQKEEVFSVRIKQVWQGDVLPPAKPESEPRWDE